MIIYIYICHVCIYLPVSSSWSGCQTHSFNFCPLRHTDRKGTTTPNNTACIGVNTWETAIVGQDNSFAVPLGEEKELCRRYAEVHLSVLRRMGQPRIWHWKLERTMTIPWDPTLAWIQQSFGEVFKRRARGPKYQPFSRHYQGVYIIHIFPK